LDVLVLLRTSSRIVDTQPTCLRVARSRSVAVDRTTELSGQLTALTALTQDDWKLLIFIVIFQAISVSLFCVRLRVQLAPQDL
jgi:hypothetical protein